MFPNVSENAEQIAVEQISKHLKNITKSTTSLGLEISIYNKWSDKKVIRQTQLLAREFPLLELPCLAIAAIHAMRNDESVTDGELWMTELWEKRKELFEHYIVDKYFSRMYPQVQITRGISSPYPFNMTALGLLYSEVLQETGKIHSQPN